MNPDNDQAAGSVRSSLAYVNTVRDQDRAIQAIPLTVLRRRNVELTVVMPCLNEAETVATCVRKAMGFLAESGIDGEVLVADNGSTDGSQQLAKEAGARGPHQRQGLRQRADGRHHRRQRQVRDHGRRRRLL
jgi:hypothetical protein